MIGIRINIVKDLLRLPVKRIAADLGVSTVMVYRYINNQSKPGYDILTKFCNTYFVNIDWMVTGDGEPFLKKQIDRINTSKKIIREVTLIKLDRNITFREIENKVGLPKGYFTDLKKGKTTMPLDKIKKIEQLYGVTF